MGASNHKMVKTYCNMCPWSCGIHVHVENGKVVSAEGDPNHPYNEKPADPITGYPGSEIRLVQHKEKIITQMKFGGAKGDPYEWFQTF